MEEGSGRFSSGELAMASWWVRNQPTIRRVGFNVLILLASLTWLYIGWTLLDTYAISYPRESRFSLEIARNQVQLAKLQQDVPQNLTIGEAGTANASDKRIDLYASIENPNSLWWAEVTYRFNISGEETPARNGFILPGQSATVAELGFSPSSAGGRSADLSVEDVRWHHVDPTLVHNDVEGFLASHLNFEISKPTFTLVPIGKKTVGQTLLTVTNHSAYGYWNADIFIRLYRGGSQSAITRLALPELKPGELRPVSITWTDPLPGITRTEAEVVVNPFDPNAYLPTTRF